MKVLLRGQVRNLKETPLRLQYDFLIGVAGRRFCYLFL